MRIAIFGTGGVGGYFGGRLAQAGEDVVFLARGEHLKAIRDQGLKVDSIKGDFVIHPAHAAADPSEVGVVDCILMAVKAWQVEESATQLGPMLGSDTFVVPLENGVEALAQLIAAAGESRVIGGLCRIISRIAAPGHIRHEGAEPQIMIGELNNHPSERTQKLLAAFHRAGISAKIPADIHVAIWEKFLFITTISGVGAVTRNPIGVFRAVPETRQMLQDCMWEIFAVADAKNVPLTEDVIMKTMSFVDALPASGTASMQRDILEGRPSELESQNGAVVRFGVETGVPTPVNSFLYSSLLPQELKARGKL